MTRVGPQSVYSFCERDVSDNSSKRLLDGNERLRDRSATPKVSFQATFLLTNMDIEELVIVGSLVLVIFLFVSKLLGWW